VLAGPAKRLLLETSRKGSYRGEEGKGETCLPVESDCGEIPWWGEGLAVCELYRAYTEDGEEEGFVRNR